MFTSDPMQQATHKHTHVHAHTHITCTPRPNILSHILEEIIISYFPFY